MRVLDLFSGIGGFSLGLEMASPEFETVAFCEQDEFCQKVLKKHWPDVPIYDDVRTLDATGLGRIDLICGGYPCQPFSVAGKRRGEEDDRHLWPSMFALIQELRPTWVIGENVAGHITMGLDEVLSDLEGEGYTARPFVVPACAVDARHRRDRVWIAAHTNSDSKSNGPINAQTQGSVAAANFNSKRRGPKQEQQAECEGASISGDDGKKELVAYASQQRREGCTHAGSNGEDWAQPRDKQPARCGGVQGGGWSPEPGVCKLSHGVSEELDRGGLNAATEKSRSNQTLRSLQQGDEAQENKRTPARSRHISQAKILQSVMHGQWSNQRHCDTFSNSETHCETSEEFVRALWFNESPFNSSQGPELEEQRNFEFTDALLIVSHQLASRSGRHCSEEAETALHGLWQAVIQSGAVQHTSDPQEKIWASMSCESQEWCIVAACFGPFWSEWPGVGRVTQKVPRRVDRLRALGNAVVPQVVQRIGEAIIQAHKEQAHE